MKRCFMLLPLVLLLALNGAAQTTSILSFTVLPQYPTPHDSIRVLANLRFASSGCNDHNTMVQDGGETIDAAVLHCPGMAAALCYTTDTFLLAPRHAGSYRFSLRLLLCGAGQVDEDSVLFTVGSAAHVGDPLPVQPVSATYTAGRLQVRVLPPGFGRYELRLYNTLGQTVLNTAGEGPLQHAVDLASGIYVLVLSDGRQQLTGRVVVP